MYGACLGKASGIRIVSCPVHHPGMTAGYSHTPSVRMQQKVGMTASSCSRNQETRPGPWNAVICSERYHRGIATFLVPVRIRQPVSHSDPWPPGRLSMLNSSSLSRVVAVDSAFSYPSPCAPISTTFVISITTKRSQHRIMQIPRQPGVLHDASPHCVCLSRLK